jgi:hypothetical protein
MTHMSANITQTDWHASPMLVPDSFWAARMLPLRLVMVSRLTADPPTFVAVTDVDILRDEG